MNGSLSDSSEKSFEGDDDVEEEYVTPKSDELLHLSNLVNELSYDPAVPNNVTQAYLQKVSMNLSFGVDSILTSFSGWNAKSLSRFGESHFHRRPEVHLGHRRGRPDPQQDEAVAVREEEELEEICDEHRGFIGGAERQRNICQEATLLLEFVYSNKAINHIASCNFQDLSCISSRVYIDKT